jgi:hypothetical protein
MSDELDPLLVELFDARRESLHDAEFIAALLADIDRQQRAASRRHALIAVIVLLVLAWQLPGLLRATASAVQAIGAHSQAYGSLLTSPLGWALSMLVGVAVILRMLPRRL